MQSLGSGRMNVPSSAVAKPPIENENEHIIEATSDEAKMKKGGDGAFYSV